MKLRTRLLSLVLGILLVSFLALSVPLYWYTRSALEDELDKRLLMSCEVVRANLDESLLLILIKEPSLSNIRKTLEEELSGFLAHEIDGLIVFGDGGTELLRVQRHGTENSPPAGLLKDMAQYDNQAVSEVFDLPGRGFFKAASMKLLDTSEPQASIVSWGGATFMTVMDEMIGSVFWIILVASVAAAGLAIVFSESLIRPVTKLSHYARSIRENIHSPQVQSSRPDEFGDLSRSMANMHSEIRDHDVATRQLLSGIAHEIKNPLGGMEIYSGLLKEELMQGGARHLAGEHLQYLEKIISELHRLNQIMSEYLDYARPVESDLKTLNVQTVVEDAFRILLPEAKQKQVHYSLSGNGIIRGDESKLRRVFVNLLKNSLEAVGEKGAVEVQILERDGTVAVQFSDTGPGIPEKDLDRIFEPYFTTRDKGYGLGLSIAKNIVDEMNGTIIVQSTEGKGTRFTVELRRESDG